MVSLKHPLGPPRDELEPMITSLTDRISPSYMSGQGDYSHYVAYLISEELVHTGSIQGAALLLAFYVLTALLIETYFFM